ncbi:prepilin-type N-terminal cleavage/methylation domain-containing protein [Candidatus Dojkabacteria bacterium]|nr:prepilin-type N-terminal cleavage/methylation domain-containing protein [Candidatus Dojkabacteria bacterium]
MLSPREKRYKAFTLIEMLIVVGILVILGSLSLASYQRMQVVMRTNEYINSLEQDVRRIQKNAMLQDRKQGEYWSFGIGIDFTEMNTDDGSGTYSVFKWCSPYKEYGDRRTTGSVPGYSKFTPNGHNLPTSRRNGDVCNSNTGDTRLYLPSRFLDLRPPRSVITVSPKPRVLGLGGKGDLMDKDLGYILFESVTGNAFFYNRNGQLINYEVKGDDIELTNNIFDLIIRIRPQRGGVNRTLTIRHLSGIMELDTN